MFPPIEPFATGHLLVSDGNEIYWETSGNPHGKPALYLHGGPGAGIMGGYRRHFDPKKYLIISFEQRGCGRSRPLATAPSSELATNTTQHLIADIEKLRIHLKVEKWLLLGISWGTTLALAYAQAHPDKVSEIVLAAVTTTTKFEVEWVTEQMRRVFPREWDQFVTAVQPEPGQRIIDAYYQKITHPDQIVRENAARAWCTWEDVHVSLAPDSKPSPRYNDPEYRLLFATLVIHYWKHAGFLNESDILSNMDRISKIPGVLIHGRLDISSPLEIAWDLHKAWHDSRFVVVDDDGHGGETMVDEINKAIEQVSDVKVKNDPLRGSR